ncbi:MAG: class I SAM-dependent methyltransferase family protein [Promethearchaeota archaeon]
MDILPCILVERQNGEKLHQWLINNVLLNRSIKICSENNWLVFPIIRNLKENEIEYLKKKIPIIRFEKRMMELKKIKKPKDLFMALKSLIPKNLHNLIPKSFDIIGKLVIIEISEELKEYEEVIGKKILTLHPSLSSVFKKVESVQGEFRLRDVYLIAGDKNTETIHKENKCNYELDIKKVYFSPRLATEHDRVSALVQKDEIILDMFAGIGPFSILIAKRKQAQVWAVDINPAATYYLNRNIILNKVDNFIRVFKGDAREVLKKMPKQNFNRIIMNLPSKSSEFIDITTQVLKKDSIIHYYQFVSESDYPVKFLEDLKKIFQRYGRSIKEILNIRKVRAYAPYIWQIGVDILVK